MITFKNKKLNIDSLFAFGFKKAGDVYEFSKNIVDNQLLLTVKIYENGSLETKVIDTSFDEEYTLHLVEDAFGTFVGRVREEHNAFLTEICEKCYDSTYFKYSQTKEIFEGVYEKYGDKPEFPFDEDNVTAVFRREDNKKWYCIKMTVKPKALGLQGNEDIEIINVKIHPEELNKIVDNNKYFRAYHMNKKMWTTVVLDGRLPTEEILKRIDDSYNLVKKT